MDNSSIIRHTVKIKSLRKNASAFQAIQRIYGPFDAYIWSFTGRKSIIGHWIAMDEVPRRTELSDIVCKDMKTYGFTFIETTTVYSFLQAIGVVNEHIVSCPRYSELLGGIDALD